MLRRPSQQSIAENPHIIRIMTCNQDGLPCRLQAQKERAHLGNADAPKGIRI